MLTQQTFDIQWGEIATIVKSDSKLPYDINVEFSKSMKVLTRRNRGIKDRATAPRPVNLLYQKRVVGVTAGPTKWDSTQQVLKNVPHCQVGDWDNGNFGDFLDGLLSLGADEQEPVS